MDTEQATQFVLREIARYTTYDDIALALSKRYDLKWDEAMAFVRQVESANYDTLQRGHKRFLVLLGGTVLVAGVGLAVTMLISPLAGWRFDLVISNLLELPYGGNVSLFLAGVAMIIGGLRGTLRAMRDR